VPCPTEALEVEVAVSSPKSSNQIVEHTEIGRKVYFYRFVFLEL
jgi:hypothetical protein